MANPEHLEILSQGIAAWSQWRSANRKVRPDLREGDLRGMDLREADLVRADLRWADLTEADLRKTDLSRANLRDAQVGEAILTGATLTDAVLIDTNLAKADLIGAYLRGAVMITADLTGTNLTDAFLWMANLRAANLTGATLTGANLAWVNLSDTNLTEADLTGASLVRAQLVDTTTKGATFLRARVYGVAAWNLQGVPANQCDLVITRHDEPVVTVDDLEVAQFVYLMLHNEKIRRVIDTIGARGVLILGRFGERMPVLDVLRNRIRGLGFAPMVFDFEKPEDRHFTGTVRTLAGMSAFIIADITAPRSVQQEAQATIPDYMVPFIPIIEKGEKPWAMFQDLWRQYEAWVRPPLYYGSIEELLPKLRSAVVRPALEMREQLRAQLAKPMPGLSLDDFPEDEDE